MKQLMLVRHAKSDWDDVSLKDFDRPLNSRGLISAPVMAERLLEKDLIPQYVFSSPAIRAKTTAGIFTQKLKLAEATYQPGIYEASYRDLLDIINNLPDAYNFVALFGHNPGLSQLLFNLSGQNYDMPTCAVAVVSFEFSSWKMISALTGTLKYYDYPKNGD